MGGRHGPGTFILWPPVDHATLHDQDGPHQRADVGERVAVHRHDVGELARHEVASRSTCAPSPDRLEQEVAAYERDRAAVQEALDDLAAGGRSYTMEEVWAEIDALEKEREGVRKLVSVLYLADRIEGLLPPEGS